MGRRATIIRGRRVAFSTRHLRAEHRDKLRAYGEILGLNMEEALDLALRLGLPEMEKKVIEAEEDEDA
jgi:hypothetical protein